MPPYERRGRWHTAFNTPNTPEILEDARSEIITKILVNEIRLAKTAATPHQTVGAEPEKIFRGSDSVEGFFQAFMTYCRIQSTPEPSHDMMKAHDTKFLQEAFKVLDDDSKELDLPWSEYFARLSSTKGS
jgi:hypothetical protein